MDDSKIVTLDLSAGDISYKLYLPNKDTDYIQKEIASKGIPYEYPMLKDIVSRCQKGDIVIDCGANIGNHTLFFLANGCFVYSFEPNPILFEIMQKSITINNYSNNTKLYNFGLSDIVSKAKFQTFDETNLGGQSLCVDDGGDIPCLPLDDISFHGKVSVIKIDVEGMEVKVLNGARKTIMQNRPLLYIEALNHKEFKAQYRILSELKYVYMDTFNASPTHLFVPEESISHKEITQNIFAHQILESYQMTQSLNYAKQLQNTINTKIFKLNELQEKIEKQALEIQALKQENNKYRTNFEGIQARNKAIQYELKCKAQEVERTKNTLSFRIGNRLIRSTKSFKTFITLPFGFYKDYQDFKKSKHKLATREVQRFVRVKGREAPQVEFNGTKPSELKVATIMDEFTYHCFKDECELCQLTFENWLEEITNFKPDLLFIESAWKGKNDSWSQKVSCCHSELVALVEWCHAQKIATMFWNKEDPVSFNVFLPVAQIVDFVFTTDVDCIPQYKQSVGHDRVYLLPFAAQPSVHNPIEKYIRKDAFNFAGSYYMRYKERQADFASLIGVVKSFKKVEIYDRNYNNPHPLYTFPDSYKEMIIGKLYPHEIDQAYKGYRFGINMNTIKQSQSMFARRVFELLASNTLVVSNFSRGLRTFFGDLVVASDEQSELIKMLKPYCEDEILYKKFRLLGLRKVMQEHTYTHRLCYIIDKIFHKPFTPKRHQALLIGVANTSAESQVILESYAKQTYTYKRLCLIAPKETQFRQKHEDVVVFADMQDFLSYLKSQSTLDTEEIFIGKLNAQNYYGENYLLDLMLASTYSNANAFGKATYFSAESSEITLANVGKEYQEVESLALDCAIVRLGSLEGHQIESLLSQESLEIENMLSLDCFNYCKGGMNANKQDLAKYVEDLYLTDQGITLDRVENLSASFPHAEEQRILQDDALKQFSGEELYSLFDTPASSRIRLSCNNAQMCISTTLAPSQHSYFFAQRAFTREELNLVDNNQVFVSVSKNTLEEIRAVFEFQDKKGEKISHSINSINSINSIALLIPEDCAFVRLGFKVVGKGEAHIAQIVFGMTQSFPYCFIGKSKKLVLTKQYPSYQDLYKYGFLHSRLRAYKRSGTLVDVFRINNKPDILYREFEGIDVACGDNLVLEQTLQSGQYDQVLVHLLDQNMWKVLEKFIDKIKVTVWVHAAEIQVWQRRSYEFERLSQEEVKRQKRLSDARVKFWNEILKNPHPNLHLVFVSEHLKNESLGDLGIALDKSKYSIIHNFIDSRVFPYHEKSLGFEKKILSLKPYHSRTYANDTAVKAVEILSQKGFFDDLEFHFVGDGDLFDVVTKPLKKFSNVRLEKRFLTQSEIAQYHRQYGILLCPTRYDSQGVSRDEAMSSGLVPITTRIAAIPEFVDEHCGILVEPEDAQGLADAIEFLYHNPKAFLELSKNASERVRAQSNFQNTIQKELELING